MRAAAASVAAAVALLAVLATVCRPAAAATSFTDVSAAAGLPTTRTRKFGGPVVAPLSNSLGAYDLLLPNHDSERTWYYANRGDGTFTRGADVLPFLEDVHGLAVGDADLDGLPEVILTRGGSNGEAPAPLEVLSLRGGRFLNVTTSAALRDAPRRGRSPRFTDVDGDGDADVVVINYRRSPDEGTPVGGSNTVQVVFANTGAGVHDAVAAGGGLGDTPVERALVTDLNGDGLPELVLFPFFRIFTAVGGGEVRLVDVTMAWAGSVGLDRLSPAFAVAALDVGGNGLTDLYVAMGPKPDVLLRNVNAQRFVDASASSGIPLDGGDHRGVAAGDLDNDGYEDLFVVRHDVPRARDYILWNNGGDGTFTVSETHGATTSPDNGRGDNAVLADMNGDGGLDAVVSNGDFQEDALAGTWSLYRNNRDGDAAGRHYLAVRVGRSPSTNGCNTGAVVQIVDGWGRQWRRRIESGGSSFSQSLLNVAHFGLGNADAPVQEVTVRWSSGEVASATAVRVDQVITLGT
ncbi:hypothetical protein BU14_0105s0020 [Porphyra umbilicalis]|uniref:ASPIC/UnbV domain-containing protein n=1 Tax=Porphyra umbilicalis TaxID=2786 RepID=A0A1X6PCK9_PORUM|nr:hypothetical protein BU14_0105s0020 [Porphyra umbilicalis]|eukprot:OSX78602.1 hypothetical protein BU14_0105s0020 [Porphyra umbilicalis]